MLVDSEVTEGGEAGGAKMINGSLLEGERGGAVIVVCLRRLAPALPIVIICQSQDASPHSRFNIEYTGEMQIFFL